MLSFSTAAEGLAETEVECAVALSYAENSKQSERPGW